MLKDKLNNLIFIKTGETGRTPNLIVMNPDTWQNILREVISCDSVEIEKNNFLLKYKGIKVFRSQDISKDIFELI